MDASILLVRYQVDGSLDPTFGVGGKSSIHLQDGYLEYASNLVIQPDGKRNHARLSDVCESIEPVWKSFFHLRTSWHRHFFFSGQRSELGPGRADQLRIKSNDSDESSFDIRLQGTAK